MTRSLPTPLAPLALLLAACAAGPDTSGLDVLGAVVDETAAPADPTAGEALRLGTERARLTEEDDLAAVLSAHGIAPDGEALGLVYELNPGLGAEDLVPGARLRVPVVEGPSAVVAAVKGGALVRVTRDAEVKHGFLEAVEEFHLALDPRLSGPAPDPELARVASTVDLVAGMVTERSRPLDPEMLAQMRDEVRLLARLAGPLPASGGDEELRSAEAAVLAAMELRRAALDETRGRLPGPPETWTLRVHTVEASLEDVDGFRIWYTPPALYPYRDSFRPGSINSLVSPAEVSLPVADYVVWATRPQPDAPELGRADVPLRRRADGEPEVVRLVVVQEAP